MTTATRSIDIEHPAYAQEALTAYHLAAQERAEALHDSIELRFEINRMKDALKELESEVVVNGGSGEIAIDGKNAEQRAAQLTVALARDPRYQAAVAKLREAERVMARADATADAAYDEMRGARLRLEWLTSWNNRVSGEEARAGKEYRFNG